MKNVVSGIMAGMIFCLFSSLALGGQLTPDGYANQKLRDAWKTGRDDRLNTYNPAVDPTLKIRDAWAAPTTPGQKNALVYFSVQTPVTAQLDSIYCPLAKEVSIFDSNPQAALFKDRFSRIRFPVSLMPGMIYRFDPNGKKMVLRDIKSPLKLGDKIPLTFQLSSAMYNHTTSAALSVLIPVRNPPASAQPAQQQPAAAAANLQPQSVPQAGGVPSNPSEPAAGAQQAMPAQSPYPAQNQ
jgi:periplasmic copper chaperone A